ANLKMLMDEVFGEENFVDTIIWKKRYGGGAKEKYLVSLHEYVLVYCKNVSVLEPIFVDSSEESIKRYYKLKDENFDKRGGYRTHPLEATKSMGDRPNLVFPIPTPDGKEVMPKRQWLWSKKRVEDALEKGELAFLKDKNGGIAVHTKQYLKDEDGNIRRSKAFSLIDDVFTQHGTNEIIDLFGKAQVFSFPKPTMFVRRLIEVGTEKDEEQIILDFFSGSGSLSHAVLSQNEKDGGKRKFICVQLPEKLEEKSEAYKEGFTTISEIAETRIKKVIEKIKAERDGKIEFESP
ncbi:site-specific DNA-methyltransferase, partial [Bernardetia sp.]|uniref:site-specific DNA-methyltransferase n=1 Tax=Bernardetia sp. TaxID=1937974 RepID=UPI0025BAE3C4